jgi:serine/threonine protein kinase
MAMKAVRKCVSSQTAKFLTVLVGTNILPKFTLERSKEKWYVETVKYPTDLGDYIDSLGPNESSFDLHAFDQIADKVHGLVDALHQKGILHGDLHAKNIVLDPATMDVRIIDLDADRTRPISELTEDDVETYVEFWEPATELKTIADLLNYERNMMWKVGYIH